MYFLYLWFTLTRSPDIQIGYGHLPVWMNCRKNKYHHSNVQTIWQEWRLPILSSYITHKCLAPVTVIQLTLI